MKMLNIFHVPVVSLVVFVLVLSIFPSGGGASDTFPLPPTLLDNAVFACQGADIGGNAVVDSIDLGAGGIRGEEGHTLSNGDIILNGRVEMHGDVIAGPGAEVVTHGNPLVTGSIGEASQLTNCHPLDLQALAAELEIANDNASIPQTDAGVDPLGGPNHRDLSVTANDVLTLAEGAYLLDSVTLTGGARILLSGPVRILCLGEISVVGGSSLNAAGGPSDLRLFSSGPLFKLESHSVVNAFVYAPDAEARIGGGAIVVGGLFADDLALNGRARVSRGLDDRDPPVVTLDEPAADCLPAGVLHTLSGAYADENPADAGAVTLAVTRSDGDASTVTALLGGDGSWTAPDVDLGTTDGQALVVVTAVDAYLNSATLTRAWRVDAGTPQVLLLTDGVPFPNQNPGLTPPPGALPWVIGHSITVSATVTDPPFA
ncbi:MAG: hypothetical protein DRJ61_14270, partial [Acidobacteria bacterium]